MFGIDDAFLIGALVSTAGSILNAFTAKRVDPPRSAQDIFYEEMVARFTKVGEMRRANAQVASLLSGQPIENFQLGGAGGKSGEQYMSEEKQTQFELPEEKPMYEPSTNISGGTPNQQAAALAQDEEMEPGYTREQLKQMRPYFRQTGFEKGKGYTLEVSSTGAPLTYVPFSTWEATPEGKEYLSTKQGQDYLYNWRYTLEGRGPRNVRH